MALTAGQDGLGRTGLRRTAAPADCPRWTRRRSMLAGAGALWLALVCVCSIVGPGPLLWASIAVIWSVLALVCIRIQAARGRPGPGTRRDERMPVARKRA